MASPEIDATSEEVFSEGKANAVDEGLEDTINPNSVQVVAPSPTDTANVEATAKASAGTKRRNNEVLEELLGAKIAKRFKVDGETKVFYGMVDEKLVDVDDADWHVTYQDGDEEDLSHNDAMKAKKYFERLQKLKEKETAFEKKKVESHATASRRSSRESKQVETYLAASAKERTGAPASKKARAPTKKAAGAAKRTGAAKKAMSAKKRTSAKKAASGTRVAASIAYDGKPDNELDGGWPEGWTMKKVVRNSGATKGGTDRYWFSPVKKYKFRSMIQVKKFIEAMKQNEGDEEKSFAAIK